MVKTLTQVIDEFLNEHPPPFPHTTQELLAYLASYGYIDDNTSRRIYFNFPIERRYLISPEVFSCCWLVDLLLVIVTCCWLYRFEYNLLIQEARQAKNNNATTVVINGAVKGVANIVNGKSNTQKNTTKVLAGTTQQLTPQPIQHNNKQTFHTY